MRQGDFELPEYVRLGEIFQDRYRLESVLGRGAVGVVIGARHLLLDRPVAIKFMLGAASEQPDSIARFVQEARSAARLKSPHVVRVFDVAVLDSGVPYIVMERLEGTDLAAVLRNSGSVGVQRGVDYVLQACEAVAEAHDAGIVHRDLKPANLFLVERTGHESAIKVLDFGIAKSSPTLSPTTLDLEEGEGVVRMTLPRSIMGSPLYMSPEQMESSGDVDARTDIWALGVTLFELVTGKVPFTGTTIVQVYSQMLARETAWLKQMPQDAPPELRYAIGRCLRRNRSERHASVRDLVRALAPLASRKPLDRTQPSPTPSFTRFPNPVVRRWTSGVGAMLGIAVLALALAVPLVVTSRSNWGRPVVVVAASEVADNKEARPGHGSDPGVARPPAATSPEEFFPPVALVPARIDEGDASPPPSSSPPVERPEPPPPTGRSPGSAQGASSHADSGARTSPPGPSVPASPPPDASSLPKFNVEEMLKARE
jgi:serine/threonine-protein kinase